MKKVLVIGSTVVDIIITLDHLPGKEEDVHVITQTMSLGGCAYNTSDMIRHFGVPYTLFSPVGTGIYGDFVRTHLLERGIVSPIPTPDKDNGCCYCFVEADGERTFISNHGAEYLFEKEWFDLLDVNEIDSVYICGLEIEETTGGNIVDWLEANPQLTVYFAPGPRLNRLTEDMMKRIFALHPILHLNEDEAMTAAASYAGSSISLETAADILFQQTGNTVIITLGAKGSYYRSTDSAAYIESVKANQIDTIGAGDSHIGAVIACRQLGMSFPDAIRTANRVAAKVVETEGALLPDDVFDGLHLI